MSVSDASALAAHDASGGQSSSRDHANDDDGAAEDWVLDAYRAVCRDASRAPSVRGLAAWRDHVLRCCLRAFQSLSLLVFIAAFSSRARSICLNNPPLRE
jgi:hypothetical protein